MTLTDERPPGQASGGTPPPDGAVATQSRTDRLLAALVEVQQRAAADPRVRRAGGAAGTVAVRVGRGLVAVARSIRPLGWTVVVLTVAAWFAGMELGWLELLTVAGVGLCLLVLCALFRVSRHECG